MPAQPLECTLLEAKWLVSVSSIRGVTSIASLNEFYAMQSYTHPSNQGITLTTINYHLWIRNKWDTTFWYSSGIA